MTFLVKKKSFLRNIPVIFFAVFLGFESYAQEETSTPAPPVKTKKTAKRLPKKHKMPEGFVPLDPTQVNFVEGVPQLAGVSEKIDMTNPTSDFEGVTQFVSGEVNWAIEAKTPAPQYKSFIRSGDKLVLEAGSYIKLVTQKRCLAVAFGPGTIEAPKGEDVSIWEIKTASLRWQCPQGLEEKLIIDDKPLTLFGGELLYHNKKLLMRAGEAQAQSGRLEPTNLYKGKDNYWVIVKNQPHPFELWKMNQEVPQPKESLRQDEPTKPALYRLSIGPVLGGAKLEHANSEVREHAGEGLKGGRIQAFIHKKKHTYVVALTSFDQNQDQGLSYSGPSTYSKVTVDTLSFGERFEPQRNWSFFYRLGLGKANLDFSLANSGCGTNCYTHGKVEYNVLTVAGGVDRIFTFPEYKSLSWVGIILSAELQYMTNTSKAKAKGGYYFATSSLDGDLKNSQLSSMGLLISAGPIFYF